MEHLEKLRPVAEWNQEEFAKFMRRCNLVGYHSYLKETLILKQSNKMKEYYLRVIFYFDITNSSRL